ncbi:probable 2-oxoglutarate-dependent dioxygenase AOP1 [Henckelia pumila]|uniref:probable 2-oxoglutarate-dependent dioxygenase AOP1 n=1 Tax=Henckelia pumila TaxID=405737 RepID=UPI003C6E32C3
MGSETIRIPIIDFSELKQEGCKSSLTWESVKNHVKLALEEFGCFEAKFDQIPKNLRNSVFEALKQLFELPLENKQRNISGKPYHGYIGQAATVPLYESIGIEHALAPGTIENFTKLLWSDQGNLDFSRSIQAFSEKLSGLDQMIRTMIVESLGIEKHIDEHLESTDYMVRVHKYDCPQGDEAEIGLVSHTDLNLLTILYQNEVNALEIMTKGGQWIAAQSSPNSFIVIVGDAFHAWTNGRLHSAHHRVMMFGDVVRYSIGLFTDPKDGYIIKAPEDLVDEEHPLLFKPYDHVKFLEFFDSEAANGMIPPNPLKAYCGA